MATVHLSTRAPPIVPVVVLVAVADFTERADRLVAAVGDEGLRGTSLPFRGLRLEKGADADLTSVL